MSQLTDLFDAVKEKNLTKTQLESYRDELTNLFASMMIEMADCEKEEAIFFSKAKEANPDLTDVAIKRSWRSSDAGLRLIVLNRYQKAVEKVLSSLKSRIYANMY